MQQEKERRNRITAYVVKRAQHLCAVEILSLFLDLYLFTDVS